MKEFVAEHLLEMLLSACFGACLAYIRRLHKEAEAQKEGMKALLRADIIRSHDKYTECGSMPVYAKDALEKEYRSYHDLGGNGTMTGLYNELMALPTESREEKDGCAAQ